MTPFPYSLNPKPNPKIRERYSIFTPLFRGNRTTTEKKCNCEPIINLYASAKRTPSRPQFSRRRPGHQMPIKPAQVVIHILALFLFENTRRSESENRSPIKRVGSRRCVDPRSMNLWNIHCWLKFRSRRYELRSHRRTNRRPLSPQPPTR